MEYLTLVKGGEQQAQKVKLRPPPHPQHPSVKYDLQLLVLMLHIHVRRYVLISMSSHVHCACMIAGRFVYICTLPFDPSVTFNLCPPSHSSSLEIIDGYFVGLLEEQDFLATREQWSKMLALVPKSVATELDKEWQDNQTMTSTERWRRLKYELRVSGGGVVGWLGIEMCFLN